jgi:hypothetical protein
LGRGRAQTINVGEIESRRCQGARGRDQTTRSRASGPTASDTCEQANATVYLRAGGRNRLFASRRTQPSICEQADATISASEWRLAVLDAPRGAPGDQGRKRVGFPPRTRQPVRGLEPAISTPVNGCPTRETARGQTRTAGWGEREVARVGASEKALRVGGARRAERPGAEASVVIVGLTSGWTASATG